MKPEDMIQYFKEDLGWVPGFVRILADHAPDALEGYITMRRAVMKPDGALPKKFKEILYVALDATKGLVSGAKAHARAAIDAGATTKELAEALVIVMLTTGAPSFELVGVEAFQAALERERELGRA